MERKNEIVKIRRGLEHGQCPAVIGHLVILIVIAGLVFSGGCINKILQKQAESSSGTSPVSVNATAITMTLGPTPGIPWPGQQEPLVQMTPAKSDIVSLVTPFTTPDPYPILHARRINATPIYNRLQRTPEYQGTFVFDGNATGLLVNAVEAPVYIAFIVQPQYDCLKKPDSCRGTLTSPVTRPYLTITVRNNQTEEIVAQDGYGREYSSDTGQYTFVISNDNGAGGTVTSTSNPGPRYIALYKAGVYHVNMEGNYLRVKVWILTGSSPTPLDVGTGDTTGMQFTDEGWG
jgi:hypothetical protein